MILCVRELDIIPIICKGSPNAATRCQLGVALLKSQRKYGFIRIETGTSFHRAQDGYDELTENLSKGQVPASADTSRSRPVEGWKGHRTLGFVDRIAILILSRSARAFIAPTMVGGAV
jgi:hypothetical protein